MSTGYSSPRSTNLRKYVWSPRVRGVGVLVPIPAPRRRRRRIHVLWNSLLSLSHLQLSQSNERTLDERKGHPFKLFLFPYRCHQPRLRKRINTSKQQLEKRFFFLHPLGHIIISPPRPPPMLEHSNSAIGHNRIVHLLHFFSSTRTMRGIHSTKGSTASNLHSAFQGSQSAESLLIPLVNRQALVQVPGRMHCKNSMNSQFPDKDEVFASKDTGYHFFFFFLIFILSPKPPPHQNHYPQSQSPEPSPVLRYATGQLYSSKQC